MLKKIELSTYSNIKDYRFYFKAKMVFFVGRPETSPDSITQEWITTQRLIQKEASDKRDLVQTGQHLLKFMNVINSACSSVKFIYSEKATRFCEISTNYLTGSTYHWLVKILQNFVAFSEYMNFT